MSEVSIIGVDLAKRVFQVHGALPSGDVAFRKKLSRSQFMKFLSEHQRWSRIFGPVVKVDCMTKEVIPNDKTKEPFARFQSQGCA